MFESFNVPGLYIAVQAVLALAASWASKAVGERTLTGIYLVLVLQAWSQHSLKTHLVERIWFTEQESSNASDLKFTMLQLMHALNYLCCTTHIYHIGC